MSKHGTALTEEQLAEFLGAGVKALALIAKENQFLKLISGGQSLVLGAVNGTEILAEAKEINCFLFIDKEQKKLCESLFK